MATLRDILGNVDATSENTNGLNGAGTLRDAVNKMQTNWVEESKRVTANQGYTPQQLREYSAQLKEREARQAGEAISDASRKFAQQLQGSTNVMQQFRETEDTSAKLMEQNNVRKSIGLPALPFILTPEKTTAILEETAKQKETERITAPKKEAEKTSKIGGIKPVSKFSQELLSTTPVKQKAEVAIERSGIEARPEKSFELQLIEHYDRLAKDETYRNDYNLQLRKADIANKIAQADEKTLGKIANVALGVGAGAVESITGGLMGKDRFFIGEYKGVKQADYYKTLVSEIQKNNPVSYGTGQLAGELAKQMAIQSMAVQFAQKGMALAQIAENTVAFNRLTKFTLGSSYSLVQNVLAQDSFKDAVKNMDDIAKQTVVDGLVWVVGGEFERAMDNVLKTVGMADSVKTNLITRTLQNSMQKIPFMERALTETAETFGQMTADILINGKVEYLSDPVLVMREVAQDMISLAILGNMGIDGNNLSAMKRDISNAKKLYDSSISNALESDNIEYRQQAYQEAMTKYTEDITGITQRYDIDKDYTYKEAEKMLKYMTEKTPIELSKMMISDDVSVTSAKNYNDAAKEAEYTQVSEQAEQIAETTNIDEKVSDIEQKILDKPLSGKVDDTLKKASIIPTVVDSDTLEFAKYLKDTFGANIVFGKYDNPILNKEYDTRGYYDANENTIFINTEFDAMKSTMMHEILHSLKSSGAKSSVDAERNAYDVLRDTIKSFVKTESTEYTKQVNEWYEKKGADSALFDEEYIANLFTELTDIGGKDFWSALIAKDYKTVKTILGGMKKSLSATPKDSDNYSVLRSIGDIKKVIDIVETALSDYKAAPKKTAEVKTVKEVKPEEVKKTEPEVKVEEKPTEAKAVEEPKKAKKPIANKTKPVEKQVKAPEKVVEKVEAVKKPISVKVEEKPVEVKIEEPEIKVDEKTISKSVSEVPNIDLTAKIKSEKGEYGIAQRGETAKKQESGKIVGVVGFNKNGVFTHIPSGVRIYSHDIKSDSELTIIANYYDSLISKFKTVQEIEAYFKQKIGDKTVGSIIQENITELIKSFEKKEFAISQLRKYLQSTKQGMSDSKLQMIEKYKQGKYSLQKDANDLVDLLNEHDIKIDKESAAKNYDLSEIYGDDGYQVKGEIRRAGSYKNFLNQYTSETDILKSEFLFTKPLDGYKTKTINANALLGKEFASGDRQIISMGDSLYSNGNIVLEQSYLPKMENKLNVADKQSEIKQVNEDFRMSEQFEPSVFPIGMDADEKNILLKDKNTGIEVVIQKKYFDYMTNKGLVPIFSKNFMAYSDVPAVLFSEFNPDAKTNTTDIKALVLPIRADKKTKPDIKYRRTAKDRENLRKEYGIDTESKLKETTYSVLESTLDEELKGKVAISANEGELDKIISPVKPLADKYSAQAKTDKGLGELKSEFDDSIKQTRNVFKQAGTMQDVIAKGYSLIKEYNSKGDYAKSEEVLLDMAELLSENGKALQAAQLISKTGKAGFIKFMNRSIAGLNQQGKAKFGNKWRTIRMLDDEYVRILNTLETDTNARETIKTAIAVRIVNEMPRSVIDQMRAWAKFAMLSSPRTHIRNTLSNIANIPVRKMDELVSVALERAIPKELRTHAFRKGKDITRVVNQSYDEVKGEFNKFNTDIVNMRNVFGVEVKPFKEGTGTRVKDWFGKGLNAAMKGNQWLMNDVEDMPFFRMAYKNSLAGYMTAQNLKQVTPEAKEFALKNALTYTYKQQNSFVSFLEKGVRENKWGTLIDVVMPFRKTPVNIFMQNIEHSPLGLAIGVKKAFDLKEARKISRQNAYDAYQDKLARIRRNPEISDAKRTKLEADAKTEYDTALSNVKIDSRLMMANTIESFAKTTAGLPGIAAGVALSMLGLITTEPEDEYEKAQYKNAVGESAYALKIGNKYMPINWAQPAMFPVLFGASIGNYIDKSDATLGSALRDGGKSLGTATITAFDNTLELPMFKSIQELFGGTSKYGAEEDGWTTLLGNAFSTLVSSVAMQNVPNILSDISTARNKYVKSTWSPMTGEAEEEGFFNDAPRVIRTTAREFMKKTGLGEKLLENNVDVWGREVERQETDLKRIVQSFFSPMVVTKDKRTDVDNEIIRLMDIYKDDKGLVPNAVSGKITKGRGITEAINLTIKQHTDWQKVAGQTSFAMLDKLIKTKEYQSGTDAQKVELIKSVYSYAQTKANDDVFYSSGFSGVKSSDINDNIKLELMKIGASLGEDKSVKDYPVSVSNELSFDGRKVELTQEQKNKFEEIYAKNINELVSAEISKKDFNLKRAEVRLNLISDSMEYARKKAMHEIYSMYFTRG